MTPPTEALEKADLGHGWRLQSDGEQIPFAIHGRTLEDFMADKEYYISARNYEREGGALVSAEVLYWREGKLRFAQLIKARELSSLQGES
jgi:hypothetical protein